MKKKALELFSRAFQLQIGDFNSVVEIYRWRILHCQTPRIMPMATTATITIIIQTWNPPAGVVVGAAEVVVAVGDTDVGKVAVGSVVGVGVGTIV